MHVQPLLIIMQLYCAVAFLHLLCHYLFNVPLSLSFKKEIFLTSISVSSNSFLLHPYGAHASPSDHNAPSLGQLVLHHLLSLSHLCQDISVPGHQSFCHPCWPVVNGGRLSGAVMVAHALCKGSTSLSWGNGERLGNTLLFALHHGGCAAMGCIRLAFATEAFDR